MNDFFIGLITAAAVIAISEGFGFLEKKLVAAMTLVGIPFIYIGFSWSHQPSLLLAVIATAFFVGLAYFGYKKNYLLLVAGLALHGIWDLVFPRFSSAAPEGYDIFCLTIDILLAIYFFLRLRPGSDPAADSL